MTDESKKKLCVFCSSSDFLDKRFYKDAKLMGELIALNGYDIVYGGSTLGMMWECASEAKMNGSKIYGVMPKRLVEMGCSTDNCDTFFLAEGMRDRKAKMDELSYGVIVLPGGFGTLEECAEMIVQKQLGYNKKPIVFLNTKGYYDKLLEFFEQMISEQFANASMRSLYYVARTPQEVIDYINNYVEPDRTPTKFEIYSR